ncbi:hypothetical protein U1Q18_033871 [Sarracenia purpurea var. burkii]
MRSVTRVGAKLPKTEDVRLNGDREETVSTTKKRRNSVSSPPTTLLAVVPPSVCLLPNQTPQRRRPLPSLISSFDAYNVLSIALSDVTTVPSLVGFESVLLFLYVAETKSRVEKLIVGDEGSPL